MDKVHQKKFIRFIKELNIYGEFIKYFNRTAISDIEACYRTGLNIVRGTIITKKQFLGMMDNHRCLINCFLWSNTKQGNNFWAIINTVWERECSEERTHTYQYILEMMTDLDECKKTINN